MHTVTVSSKFQVVIPREMRERLGIKPGEQVQMFEYDGRLEVVRLKHPRELRGFLRGIDTDVLREDDRV